MFKVNSVYSSYLSGENDEGQRERERRERISKEGRVRPNDMGIPEFKQELEWFSGSSSRD